MTVIVAVIVLFVIIVLLGLAAALTKDEDVGGSEDGRGEELPRVIVTRQVPSVFDRRKPRR